MGMELVGKSKRTLAGIVCWFFETAGYLVALALVLIINSNWRLLLAMYTLPSLFIFTYKWIVPESPRWLVSQGRSEEAAKILMTTAKVNKVRQKNSFWRFSHHTQNADELMNSGPSVIWALEDSHHARGWLQLIRQSLHTRPLSIQKHEI